MTEAIHKEIISSSFSVINLEQLSRKLFGIRLGCVSFFSVSNSEIFGAA